MFGIHFQTKNGKQFENHHLKSLNLKEGVLNGTRISKLNSEIGSNPKNNEDRNVKVDSPKLVEDKTDQFGKKEINLIKDEGFSKQKMVIDQKNEGKFNFN